MMMASGRTVADGVEITHAEAITRMSLGKIVADAAVIMSAAGIAIGSVDTSADADVIKGMSA